MSLTKVTYAMIKGSPLNILDFGADPTGVADSTAAFNAAVAEGTYIYFPAGEYKFDSTLTVDGIEGLMLEGAGAGLITAGTTYANNTVFNFDGATAGTDGLVISNFVGLVIKNIVIKQDHASAGGGNALYLFGGHDFILENIKVDSQTGSTGNGIVLGDGTGVTAAFQGKLQNCKVISEGGGAIVSNTTNTSITLESCYVIGGKYQFEGTVYSSLISCAADGSQFYGYEFTNCNGITLVSCGAEACTLGAIYLNACANITITSFWGTGNNTSGSTTIGDLVYLDGITGGAGGKNYNITISNPTSSDPDAATVASIYATSNNGTTYVENANTIWLQSGIGGNQVWIENELTLSGDNENIAFTPTLDTNWTNVGTPTVTGYYNKKGKLVTVFITVTPATSIKADAGAKILIPWDQLVPSTANVVNGSNVAYGTANINNAEIYLQTMGSAITVPLYVTGQFLIF